MGLGLTKHESESFTKKLNKTAIFKCPAYRILHFQKLKTQNTKQELQNFLCSVAKDKVEREVDGPTRNEKKSSRFAELMAAAHGDRPHSKTVVEEVKKKKILELRSD